MSYHCFKCGSELELLSPTSVGRREECPKCRADVHVCKNCERHDPSAYNECRDPQAERVVDKDRSNFCDLFTMRVGMKGAAAKDPAAEAKKKLDDLFK